MTGIDLTPGFIDLARNDAARRGVEVEYVLGDMRQISFNREFDRILMLFTAFGYFEDDENLQVLRNVQHALKPGGLLLFDTHNRDMFLKGLLPSFVIEKDGNLMIDRVTFDTLTGKMHNHRIVIRNGIRKDKPFFVRLYNPTEITQLLHVAGFEVHDLLGDWEGQPVSTELRRMIVIARKPTSE